MSLETAGEKSTIEAEILLDIREAEKKAEEMLEKARKEKESIIHEAHSNSLNLLVQKEEELRKLQEKKLSEFKDKAKIVREEKLAEGKASVKQLKAKAEKIIPRAVELAMKKFEEMV